MSHEPDMSPLSAMDFHVLLVLASGDLYGYGIMKAVEAESDGSLSPEIGSLYRILARLMTEGLVDEVDAPPDAPAVHRGRARRYYGLTRAGRRALAAESARLDRVMRLVRTRNVLPERG